MNKLPGVLLFVILALVILQIFTLRSLSNAEKRITALEQKITKLIEPQPNVTSSVPAPPPASP